MKIFSSVPKNEISEVLIFGGYKGDSIAGWLKRNPGARILAYEPVPEYAAVLASRFPQPHVLVRVCGVGSKNGSRQFAVMSDATSGHPAITGATEVAHPMVDVKFSSVEVASKDWSEKTDVAEINIEGGEYELISALTDAHQLERIKHVFVQFHDVGLETEAHIRLARSQLAQSHSQIWCYDLVWEYWRLAEPRTREFT